MNINTNTWNRIRYTLWAPIYDWIAAFPTYRRRSVDMLGLVPGEDVLIVGAGTGADLPHLPTTVNVTAIDLTPAMLNRLRDRAQALGRSVDARVMDGQALDLPGAQFDAVILHLILAVIPDPVACIREVERVLKPGGRVVIFDKFVPDADEPGLGRRITNVVTNLLFSDITRKLGPIIAHTNLAVEREESGRIAGVPYRTVVLSKKG